ncbi:hypothetical protein Cassandra_0214 [Pseudomonas phage Cassandra]|nr:hypothetical protein Cassandra_0214 [Pseudomonas phage Cassandra]
MRIFVMCTDAGPSPAFWQEPNCGITYDTKDAYGDFSVNDIFKVLVKKVNIVLCANVSNYEILSYSRFLKSCT